MKRIIAIFVLGLLLISGYRAAAGKPQDIFEITMVTKNNTLLVQFSSKPHLLERGESVIVQIDGMTSQLKEPNKPVLPLFTRTYLLPFGSKNITVTCTPQDIRTMTLTKKIMSARIAPLSKMNQMTTYETNSTIYESTAY